MSKFINTSIYLKFFFMCCLLIISTAPSLATEPTPEQAKAQEEGLKTAAEAKTLTELNKGVATSAEDSVKSLAATRGINETVFKNKPADETIDMITYKVRGGHIINAKANEKELDLIKQYDLAYNTVLEAETAVVKATLQRDRASTVAEKQAFLREQLREKAAKLDALQREKVTDEELSMIGKGQKEYLTAKEMAQISADRYVEAQATLEVVQQKAEDARTKFRIASEQYINDNKELILEEMKKTEKEISALSK